MLLSRRESVRSGSVKAVCVCAVTAVTNSIIHRSAHLFVCLQHCGMDEGAERQYEPCGQAPFHPTIPTALWLDPYSARIDRKKKSRLFWKIHQSWWNKIFWSRKKRVKILRAKKSPYSAKILYSYFSIPYILENPIKIPRKEKKTLLATPGSRLVIRSEFCGTWVGPSLDRDRVRVNFHRLQNLCRITVHCWSWNS